MQVCCIRDSYIMSGSLNPANPVASWFQLPITVEVFDKNMNPVSNAKVEVRVDGNPANKYDQIKYTNANGKSIFGYSDKYINNPQERDVQIIVTKNKQDIRYGIQIWIDED